MTVERVVVRRVRELAGVVSRGHKVLLEHPLVTLAPGEELGAVPVRNKICWHSWKKATARGQQCRGGLQRMAVNDAVAVVGDESDGGLAAALGGHGPVLHSSSFEEADAKGAAAVLTVSMPALCMKKSWAAGMLPMKLMSCAHAVLRSGSCGPSNVTFFSRCAPYGQGVQGNSERSAAASTLVFGVERIATQVHQ